jgi:predicted patatin/cPLA2 family phospholipase
MKKIAIIGSEGGMSCAYFTGAILALVEKYSLTDPYIVIGSSGSTGTLAYYVSKQYKSIKNIWQNLLPSKKFVSFWRPKEIMDIDYLIDDIFKKQDILNTQAIKESKIKFFIAITNVHSRKIEYVNNKDNVDIFEALRASNAAPVAYNKWVRINHKEYVDGAIEAPLSVNIKKAQKEGAEIIIAFDNSHHDFAANALLKFYSFFVGKVFLRRVKSYLRHTEYHNADKNVLIIKPSVKLPITVLDNKRKHIIKTMHIGHSDVMKNKELEELLKF